MIQRCDSDLQAKSLSLSVPNPSSYPKSDLRPGSAGTNRPPFSNNGQGNKPTGVNGLATKMERLEGDWPSSTTSHGTTSTAIEEAPQELETSSVIQDEPELPPEEGGFIPVLKNRNFLALWGGQVFSQLADKVFLVLAIALITSHFQGVGQTISGWVSAIMIAFTIPAVLFGSLAGVFVDRIPKKIMLVATNLLRGMFVLMILPLLWISQGWGNFYGLPVGFEMLLVITFLVSTLTQFFAPAEQAVIPLIVEKRHLLSANSLYTMTMMASVIIGFAVGEPLLALADTLLKSLGAAEEIGKELVVGGSYLLAGIVLFVMNTGEKPHPPDHEFPHPLEDLRDGFNYLRQNHRVRSALIQLVVLFSIFAALSVLAVRMAEVIPGLKASQFGFLLAAGGVGMAAGATYLGHGGQSLCHRRLSLYGSLGVAACLLGFALLPPNLWLSLLLMALLGACASLVGVPMQTTIQAETPEQMRGKVFGLQNNVVNIALTVPLALAGVAETMVGLNVVFLALGGMAIAGGIITWYISGTGLAVSTNVDKLASSAKDQ